MSKKKYKDDLQILKRIPILDYGETVYGLTPYKARSRYWSFREHDSIMVSVEENKYFRNSCDEQGDIIDFVCNFEHISFKEACDVLRKYLGNTPISSLPVRRKVEKKPFKAPYKENRFKTFEENNRYIIKYLCGKRKISINVLKWLTFKGNVFQERYKRNAIFASYVKGKMIYAQRCRTDNNVESHKRRFEIEGSDCTYCWKVNNNSKTLIVGEAVIDLLSFMTLLEMQNKDYKHFDYLSTNGVNKTKSVLRAIEEGNYTGIVLCFDNDKAGDKAKEFVCDHLAEMNFKGKIFDKTPEGEGSDVNDFLMHIISEIKGTTDIHNKNCEVNVDTLNKENDQTHIVFQNDKYVIYGNNVNNHLLIADKETGKVISHVNANKQNVNGKQLLLMVI